MDLVRIQIEVLFPGCKVVGNHNIPMYAHPPRPFLSRPSPVLWKLEGAWDKIVIAEQLARLHFQSIGTAIDGVTLGDLDFLLTLKTEEELFNPWIDEFIELAVREGETTEPNYKRLCRIAVFDVDVKHEKIQFAGWLPTDNKLRKVLVNDEFGEFPCVKCGAECEPHAPWCTH